MSSINVTNLEPATRHEHATLLRDSTSTLDSRGLLPDNIGDCEKRTPSCVHQNPVKWKCISFCLILSSICICLIIILGVKISQDNEIRFQEPCPEKWIYINRTCYYISEEERGWEFSRNFCQSQGASLLLLKSNQDLVFARKLICRKEFWIGLQRIQEKLTWLDGTSYNQSLHHIENTGECAFIDWKQISMSGCELPQRWICKLKSYGKEAKLGSEERTMVNGLASQYH